RSPNGAGFQKRGIPRACLRGGERCGPHAGPTLQMHCAFLSFFKSAFGLLTRETEYFTIVPLPYVDGLRQPCGPTEPASRYAIGTMEVAPTQFSYYRKATNSHCRVRSYRSDPITFIALTRYS